MHPRGWRLDRGVRLPCACFLPRGYRSSLRVLERFAGERGDCVEFVRDLRFVHWGALGFSIFALDWAVKGAAGVAGKILGAFRLEGEEGAAS